MGYFPAKPLEPQRSDRVKGKGGVDQAARRARDQDAVGRGVTRPSSDVTPGQGGVARCGQCPLSNGPEPNAICPSICRKPLVFNANTQTKAFVAPGRDLITFLFVCRHAADIRHEYTGFPGNVGADVP